MEPDIKLLINGEEFTLSNELRKTINEQIIQRNPFARVGHGEKYFFIDGQDDIASFSETNNRLDRKQEVHANYFNNYMYARQTMLHQLLYRKLLQFAYKWNAFDNRPWDSITDHFYIVYNYTYKKFEFAASTTLKQNTVYFATISAAKKAIEDVVEPFCKEYPEFDW